MEEDEKKEDEFIIPDSEAKEALKRLKDFSELMIKGDNQHTPIHELIKLCHEEISANDTYIFKNSSIMREDQN